MKWTFLSQVKYEGLIKAQIFSLIKGKPYEEHVVRRIHFVENYPKHQRKEDKQVRLIINKVLSQNYQRFWKKKK